jgi:hypothetical protein
MSEQWGIGFEENEDAYDFAHRLATIGGGKLVLESLRFEEIRMLAAILYPVTFDHCTDPDLVPKWSERVKEFPISSHDRALIIGRMSGQIRKAYVRELQRLQQQRKRADGRDDVILGDEWTSREGYAEAFRQMTLDLLAQIQKELDAIPT